MKKRQILTLAATLLCLPSLKAFADEIPYGIVNFRSCITNSKYGKQERELFEKQREQIASVGADIEKQLQEIAAKFQDPEFVDSLSPEAEQELKSRFQSLSEEFNRHQNQYMQIMQQAEMKLVQTMSSHVSQASEKIAKKQQLPMVVREELCFFYNPSFDITPSIIEEMDESYVKQSNAENPPALGQVEK